MPFSNDESIIEENSRLKIAILVLSFGLFASSCYTTCFCTTDGCRYSLEALLMGWMAMLADTGAIAWLANPLLITTWILQAKSKKTAWIFSLLALIASLSFLKVHTIIKDEAGNNSIITKVGVGYWLWLASISVAFVGSMALRIAKYNRQ